MSFFSVWMAAVVALLGQNVDRLPAETPTTVSDEQVSTTAEATPEADVEFQPGAKVEQRNQPRTVRVQRSNGRLCVTANGRTCSAADSAELRRKDPELYDAYLDTLEQANEIAASLNEAERHMKRELARLDTGTFDIQREFGSFDTAPIAPTTSGFASLRVERLGSNLSAGSMVRDEFSRSVMVDANGKVTVKTNDNGYTTTEQFRSTAELKRKAPEIHRSLDLQVP